MKTFRKLQLAIFALFSVLLVAQPAMAAPLIDYSATDINWYDERGNNICGASTDGLGGGDIVNAEDNEKAIFFTLLANGFTKIEAAAILGNLQQESNFNPKSHETGNTAEGRGLVQWGVNGRWKIMMSGVAGQGEFAAAKGKDPWELATQMQFMFHELTHGYKSAYQKFKAASSLDDKIGAWEKYYEQAGITGLRFKYAHDVLNKEYYKTAQDTNGGDITSGENGSQGGSGSCSVSGGASQYVDGFIVYNQYDPRWKNHAYGSSTIGDSGCGPSAMAMIITNLTGKSVTPVDVADWAGPRGYLVGGGSRWDISPGAAERWGMSSKAISNSETAMNAALRSGAMIILTGQGPPPFTTGGHFIVIRAVTDDGKWLVGDSAHVATNKQKFDPRDILASANKGSAYAISK